MLCSDYDVELTLLCLLMTIGCGFSSILVYRGTVGPLHLGAEGAPTLRWTLPDDVPMIYTCMMDLSHLKNASMRCMHAIYDLGVMASRSALPTSGLLWFITKNLLVLALRHVMDLQEYVTQILKWSILTFWQFAIIPGLLQPLRMNKCKQYWTWALSDEYTAHVH